MRKKTGKKRAKKINENLSFGLMAGAQTVKKLIHCERKGSGHKGWPEFIPQAEFISAEENPVFLRPDKVQGFPQK